MADLIVMKGSKYTEKRLREWFQADGAVVVQTKRDEFRCVVQVCMLDEKLNDGTDDRAAHDFVKYTSAQGKPLYNLGCFNDMWLEIARVTGQRKFDMGCMVSNSFNLTRRTLRASKKSYDLTGNTVHEIIEKGKKTKMPDGTMLVTPGFYYMGKLKAQFWFYDLPEHPELYNERRAIMATYHRNFPEFTGIPETEVVTVPWGGSVSDGVAQVNVLFQAMLDAGHEGAMIKRFEHPYKVGRSTDWMKMKPEDEVDVEIIDYIPGEGAFSGLVGSLVGRAEDGSIVSFSGFSYELRCAISANFEAYRGRWAEVRFMQREETGGYRHPRFYRWHPDK